MGVGVERRREAYLQRLGIDVWVRRGARRPERVQPPVSTQPPERVRPPGPAQRATAQPSPPAPRPSAEKPPPARRPPVAETPVEAFRIRCFRYGRVFAAIAEDAWPWRRFLLDVARALNGFEVAERENLVFEWPQPGGDPAGGPRAFRAFLGHQTRNSERCLISGQWLLELLDTDADGVTDVAGRIYVAPGAPDAETKKRLWQRIRQL